ncbi:BEACH domain-containing protein LvsA-like protein [Tanacetum coccineum]
MKKSRSQMRIADDNDEDDVNLRRPTTTRESRNVVDEEVDIKADHFISRFKQQLRLQRLESLARYNDMLKRQSYKSEFRASFQARFN